MTHVMSSGLSACGEYETVKNTRSCFLITSAQMLTLRSFIRSQKSQRVRCKLLEVTRKKTYTASIIGLTIFTLEATKQAKISKPLKR